jgi:hypothetical protein
MGGAINIIFVLEDHIYPLYCTYGLSSSLLFVTHEALLLLLSNFDLNS